MRESLKLEKYNEIYEQVATIYDTKYKSVVSACNEMNISRNYYYQICRKLSLPSVASINYDMPTLATFQGATQRGGKKIIESKSINVNSKNDRNDERETTYNEAEIETKLRYFEQIYLQWIRCKSTKQNDKNYGNNG